MEAVQKTTASSQVPESREARARKHDTLDKIAKLTLRYIFSNNSAPMHVILISYVGLEHVVHNAYYCGITSIT